MIADEAEPDPEKVHLTARVPLDAAADVVKDEARKGYDLMFIGLEDSVEEDGGFVPVHHRAGRRLRRPAGCVRQRRRRSGAADRPQPVRWCR